MGDPVCQIASLDFKDIDLTGDQTAEAVWTPASGKTVIITGWSLTLTAAGTLKLFVGTDAAANRILYLNVPANGGESRQFPEGQGIAMAADAVLKVTSTGGGDVNGTIYGYEQE